MAVNAELKARIDAAFQECKAEIFEIGELIWRHPETGFREFETSALLRERLKAHGLEARPAAYTGFRVDIDTGRPGPTVGVVGELDALLQPGHPDALAGTGAAHTCGHHTHASAMFGTAVVLLRPEILSCLSGRIAIIAAPAEEGIELAYRKQLMCEGKIQRFNGKPQLIKEGVFDDVDMAFMNHVGGGYGTSDSNGFIMKNVRFFGKSTHAAYPFRGVNALNGMDLARHAIALLREAASSADQTTRIHGIISDGGKGISTLPDATAMEYMLRAGKVESLQRLSKQFDRAVGHAALACGCGCEVETIPGEMPLLNCDALGEVYARVLKESFDAEMSFKMGWDYGCTDMGDVSQIIPAVHINVPGSNSKNHTDTFAITEPEKAFIGNSRLLSLVTAELLAGDAEEAKKVIAASRPPMARDAYIAAVEALASTVEFHADPL